jgi:hypothetical protein
LPQWAWPARAEHDFALSTGNDGEFALAQVRRDLRHQARMHAGNFNTMLVPNAFPSDVPPLVRSMKFQRCTNPACRRPFQVNEFDSRTSDTSHLGQIVCPHCGHAEAAWSNSIFLVHALSPEEEAQFDQKERQSDRQDAPPRRKDPKR